MKLFGGPKAGRAGRQDGPAPRGAPATYAEWSRWAESLESGSDDEAVLAAAASGELSWTSGVAENFSRRVDGAYDARLARCGELLQRDLRSGSEPAVVRGLLDARRRLGFLHALAVSASFDAVLTEHLAAKVKAYADAAQDSLERSAAADRSGLLASAARKHSLWRYADSEDTPPAAAQPATKHRRILT